MKELIFFSNEHSNSGLSWWKLFEQLVDHRQELYPSRQMKDCFVGKSVSLKSWSFRFKKFSTDLRYPSLLRGSWWSLARESICEKNPAVIDTRWVRLHNQKDSVLAKSFLTVANRSGLDTILTSLNTISLKLYPAEIYLVKSNNTNTRTRG